MEDLQPHVQVVPRVRITVERDGDLATMSEALDDIDREEIIEAIQAIGFECTDCGACCRGDSSEHVATVFPDEARELLDEDEQWLDVVQPMPFGLDEAGRGTTLEWSLQTTSCGDCRFLEMDGETSQCTRYADRPSICRTYPFTLVQSPEAPPQGDVVDEVGPVQAHECEGLGTDIGREQAEDLADELIARAERSIEEATEVRAQLRESPPAAAETTVVDSEGYKRPDGTSLSQSNPQR